jgi:hypothetical protein
METNVNTNKCHFERETLELVLEEFAQEQKTNNQHIEALIVAVNNVGDKIDVLEKEHKKERVTLDPLDIKPIETILQKGFHDMKFMIDRQPKNIIKKFQILLFPEQDAKLFYKIVFGRWFLWLVILVAINSLYNWGIHYSDNRKEIEILEIQNDRIRKAWDYMHANSGEGTKKLMKKAYLKSVGSK